MSNKLLPSDKLKEAYPKINDMIDRIDNLVGQTGDSNTEIVDARYSSVKSKTFTVLKDRLDEAETDTQSLDTRTTDLENRLDTVEKTTITISDRIHHIANTIYGQVSVELSGVTRTNLVKSSNMDADTNADGVVDDFSKAQTSNLTATWSLDTTENAQKIEVTGSTDNDELAVVYQVIDNIVEGQIYSFLVNSKIQVNAGSFDGQIILVWRDNSNTILKATDTKAITNTTFSNIKLENITAPTGATNVKVELRARVNTSGDTGIVWFRNALFEKASTVGSYISSGVKSTVSTRLKVVGKNLVRNGNGEEGLNYWHDNVNATGTWDTNEKAFKVVSAANANVVSDLFKISPSKQYTISAKVKSDGVNDSFVAVQWYDKAGNFISSTQGNKVTSTTYATSTNLATPPKNAVIAKISLFNVNAHTAYFKEVQLEEGTTATEYEPYKESVAYITLPEGVDGLHSLPNGVKDKVSDDGELIKRTKKRNDIHLQTAWSVDLELTNTIRFSKNISADATTLISRSGILQIGDVIFNFNDNTINKDEELFDIYDDIIYIRVNKSRLSTLDSAGLEAWLQAQGSSALIYQLQTPKYYELVGVEDLYTFDGETTVIIEPAIKFEAIADSNGQIAIPNPELPIDFIESVKEKIVDGDSISYIDASYSQVDDTTIGGLTYGKKYRIVYHYPAELTTGPIIEATYEINTAATIVGLLDVQRRLEKELGSVWVTLLPLADKELQMYAISTIPDTSTATTQELGDKINELINVWK